MSVTLPDLHADTLERIIAAVREDARFQAILGGGSLVHGGFDLHSDLDLVLVATPDSYADVMENRRTIAQGMGELLAAFTGEHVGEPRLLICLYGPPLIHVDLKFVRPADLDRMVERPQILWARTEAEIASRIDAADVGWPNKDPQWFEDRAWVWLHYGATRLLRGELFEAIGMLGFFREQVLGPMVRQAAGRPQRGVRRIDGESDARAALRGTHPAYDAREIVKALERSIDLYLDLRRGHPPSAPTPHMPDALRSLIASGQG
jgi:hypothetical protein